MIVLIHQSLHPIFPKFTNSHLANWPAYWSHPTHVDHKTSTNQWNNSHLAWPSHQFKNSDSSEFKNRRPPSLPNFASSPVWPNWNSVVSILKVPFLTALVSLNLGAISWMGPYPLSSPDSPSLVMWTWDFAAYQGLSRPPLPPSPPSSPWPSVHLRPTSWTSATSSSSPTKSKVPSKTSTSPPPSSLKLVQTNSRGAFQLHWAKRLDVSSNQFSGPLPINISGCVLNFASNSHPSLTFPLTIAI